MHQTSRSAARILDILELLAERPAGVSLTECASVLDLPKSSALVLLRTAMERGYITRDARDHYTLNETFRAYGFGWGGHRLARLLALAQPVMADLCRSLEETVLLGTYGERHVRGLAKVLPDQMVRYDAELSRPWPYYCTAMGRTLVAHAEPERRDALLELAPRRKFGPRTVTDPAQLRQIVEEISIAGIAIVEDEFEVGGTGTAVPILDGSGAILAVMNVGCVTSRFHSKTERIIRELRQAAGILEQRVAGKSDEQHIARQQERGSR